MLIGYLEKYKFQIRNQNNSSFDEILKIIGSTDFSSMEDGTYELDGKNLYYILVSYNTKVRNEPVALEVHKKYIDFFYILDGKETINYVSNDGSYAYSSNFDPDKDIEFIEDVTDVSSLVFKKGMFAVFFPGELHIAGIATGQSLPVRRLIFKVLFK